MSHRRVTIPSPATAEKEETSLSPRVTLTAALPVLPDLPTATTETTCCPVTPAVGRIALKVPSAATSIGPDRAGSLEAAPSGDICQLTDAKPPIRGSPA